MKKVITVFQPWAALLVTGKKRCETRSRKTDYRGELLIHAGKKEPLYTALMMRNDGFDRALRSAIFPEDPLSYLKNLPVGVIIGKVNLVNCVRIDEMTAALIKEQHPDEYEFGDFTVGRYAWVMEDPVVFPEPIPASGKQGFWNWDGEEG